MIAGYINTLPTLWITKTCAVIHIAEESSMHPYGCLKRRLRKSKYVTVSFTFFYINKKLGGSKSEMVYLFRVAKRLKKRDVDNTS
jgi:hypothetical protein